MVKVFLSGTVWMCRVAFQGEWSPAAAAGNSERARATHRPGWTPGGASHPWTHSTYHKQCTHQMATRKSGVQLRRLTRSCTDGDLTKGQIGQTWSGRSGNWLTTTCHPPHPHAHPCQAGNYACVSKSRWVSFVNANTDLFMWLVPVALAVLVLRVGYQTEVFLFCMSSHGLKRSIKKRDRKAARRRRYSKGATGSRRTWRTPRAKWKVSPVLGVQSKLDCAQSLSFLGSSLVAGHIPTHPFLEADPNPDPTLSQTLNLTWGRVGKWPATEQGR